MRDMISAQTKGGGEGGEGAAGDDPADIGLAQLVFYGGGREEQGRSLFSLYSAYCQQVCLFTQHNRERGVSSLALSLPPSLSLSLRGPRTIKAKPILFGWNGKTVEAVKDPDTRLTAYQDLTHPLSVPHRSTDAGALSRPVHVGEGDVLELWASRLGESNQELFDRSVACGVVTEFVHDIPGEGLPALEEYVDKVHRLRV